MIVPPRRRSRGAGATAGAAAFAAWFVPGDAAGPWAWAVHGVGTLSAGGVGDWNTLLIEVAGALGKRHPDVALRRLLPLLDDDHARVAAIGILARRQVVA